MTAKTNKKTLGGDEKKKKKNRSPSPKTSGRKNGQSQRGGAHKVTGLYS